MASKLVELLISAKDATKGAFNSVVKRMSFLEKKATALKNIGSVVGGLFAGYGALKSFRAVIAATREQEDALRQVEARLKSTDNVSGETLDSLKKMAEGLQDITTYGDEAILKMQSLLLTFTNIKGDTFQAATESILDMSIAMGQDLKTSALQVGKALNDPIAGINALTRVGVKLTDQQKEQIRTFTELGQVEKAQAVILKELQKEFGGAAEEAAKTFGGALNQLSNAFGDLLESDKLGGATQAIKDLTAVLKDPATVQAFDTFTSAIFNAITKTADFVTALSNADKVLSEIRYDHNIEQLDELSKKLDYYTKKADEAFNANDMETFSELQGTINELTIAYDNVNESIENYKQEIFDSVKATVDQKTASKEQEEQIKSSSDAFVKEKETIKATTSEIKNYTKAKQDDLEKDVGKRLGKDADLETIDLVRKLQDARRHEGEYGDPAQALRDAKEAIRVAGVLRENSKASQHFLDSMVKQAAEIARNAADAEKDTTQQTVNQQIKQTIDVGEVTNEITTKLVDIQTILDKNPLKIRFVADVNAQNIAKQALKEGTKQ